MEFLPQEPDNEVRELSPEEIKSLAPHFQERGVPLPDPAFSTFVGAVCDGRVVAFQCLQLRLHAEPMLIEPGYAHLFLPLCRKSEDLILSKCGQQEVLILVEPGRVEELAKAMGMVPQSYIVMTKTVRYPEPRPLVSFIDLPAAKEVTQ